MDQVHAYVAYEHELQKLRARLAEMGREVRAMLKLSLVSLATRHTDLASSTIGVNHRVNRFEVEIDEMCLKILVRRQPVASDLRFVATARKLVTDLERIGDLCVNVCERVGELRHPGDLATIDRLARIGDHVGDMIDAALSGFLTKDLTPAKGVLEDDAVIDEAYAELFERLVEQIRHDEADAFDAMRLHSVAKYLERIGDHARNLAKTVVFMVDAKTSVTSDGWPPEDERRRQPIGDARERAGTTPCRSVPSPPTV